MRIPLLALVLAAAFGAGDQYLGSLSAYPWAADVSLLSAPWLLLAFVAGATQRDPRRAVLLGLGCTYAALLGYGLMTLSPLENAHYTLVGIRGFAIGEQDVLLGGVLTGPLFGWLGRRWRTDGSALAAVATSAALCLEPLARLDSVNPVRFTQVWVAEVAAGLALATVALARRGRLESR